MGGMGCMSFRREPKIPRGGPDGGNGGRGGRGLLVADDQVVDLSPFRHRVHHRAANGGHGQGKARHGHAGADLRVSVPPGTRVIRDGHTIAELQNVGDSVAVARGGDGGIGNKAFKSSTNRAPRRTIPGAPGEEAWLTLERRLPVDAALGSAAPRGVVDALAVMVTALAVWTEQTADRQLHEYRLSQHAKGSVLNTGLWAYSRHPNYLGEIFFWVSLWLFGVSAAPQVWWTIVGPVAMIAMFVFASIPMMEARSRERRPGYADYAARTSVLIPWYPRSR